MDQTVIDAVTCDNISARVTIYCDKEINLQTFRKDVEREFKKHYPEITMNFGGYMIPDGVMQNTPFWFINVDDIKRMSEILNESLKMNEDFHATIYTKYNSHSFDHIGRETFDVGYKPVYQK